MLFPRIGNRVPGSIGANNLKKTRANSRVKACHLIHCFGHRMHCFWPTLGRLLVDFGPTLGKLLADFGQTFAQLWADFWPTLGQLLVMPIGIHHCTEHCTGHDFVRNIQYVRNAYRKYGTTYKSSIVCAACGNWQPLGDQRTACSGQVRASLPPIGHIPIFPCWGSSGKSARS